MSPTTTLENPERTVRQTADTQPRMAARIAGLSYLALFVLALFANFFVRERLVDLDDAAATFQNIASSEMLFRSGMVAFLAIFLLDVVIAWALYVVFRGVGEQVSRLAAWFRLTYTVMLGVALVFFFLVIQLVTGSTDLGGVDQAQIDGQVMLFLDAFNFAWLIGLAAFGIHLILIAKLMLGSRIAPRALGIIIAIAGSAYVFDTVAKGMIASYDDYAAIFLAIVAIPSIIGELWFGVWLLMRGWGSDDSFATPTETVPAGA